MNENVDISQLLVQMLVASLRIEQPTLCQPDKALKLFNLFQLYWQTQFKIIRQIMDCPPKVLVLEFRFCLNRSVITQQPDQLSFQTEQSSTSTTLQSKNILASISEVVFSSSSQSFKVHQEASENENLLDNFLLFFLSAKWAAETFCQF